MSRGRSIVVVERVRQGAWRCLDRGFSIARASEADLAVRRVGTIGRAASVRRVSGALRA